MPRQPFPGFISSVEAQSKTRKHLGVRVNVFVNEKFSFALDAALANRRGLTAGRQISSDELTALLAEDGDAKAYARALHFLGYRIRSAQEISTRLKRDEWPDDVIERVLARLVEEKLLDDSQFAAAWVENRTQHRPRGARLLKQELRQKGVEKETIEAALPASEDESENAFVALQPKWRLWGKLEERERDRKAIEYLQRRGFAFSVARAAVRRQGECD